jgi:RNA polymerase sigma-70 factor (ECF subfamily)
VDTSPAQLQRLRSGEESAWGELHRDHYPRLWSSVQRILNNPTLADDVVQEAFIKAHRDIHRFAGQSQLGSFLSPVAEHENQPSMPEGHVPAMVSAGMENTELRKAIFEAMTELSAEHRAVIQLRLIDEMSLEETARLLRCKPGTVNSRLHYACEHLRRKLVKVRKAR